MNFSCVKALLGATALTIVSASAASAGGFSRGTADTDILYEDGNFNLRSSVTIVNPTREFTSARNPDLVGTSYTDTYAIPSAAVKINLFDPLRCAATLTDAFGGSAKYVAPKPSGKLEEDFQVHEMGLTCAAKFEIGQGNVYLLGGVFQEQFDYNRINEIHVPGVGYLGQARLRLESTEYGYRVGAGYTIPEIAFRAQLMYRSAATHQADGTITVPGALVPSPEPTVTLPAVGFGNLPQSVELKVQSGVAPGWLAFGSAKWTDWSVQKALVVVTPLATSNDIYNWKDGWTVTGGVGHAFTDKISGLASLTWDSGVETGWDFSSDTYTLALGASFKDPIGGELRAGFGLSYLASANIIHGDDAGSAVDSGWAYALSAGYAVKW
ncbi:outer membrane protein transport protein [Mesorhizobium sp. ANAO-SY3R2]|uniref:outer membrane protein transport protein n=1 Tax=Mesorhizobium sp. ANAO-SY3R2 TaxID=3166644 RepID=UPI00366DA921